MTHHDPLGSLTFPSNAPLTDLLQDLKKALSTRYIGYSDVEKRIRVPSFMKETYQGLEYRHGNIIKLFDQALSLDWLENDRSETRLTVPSIMSSALAQSSTQSSWQYMESGAGSSNGSEQLNSGPVV